MVSVLDSYIDFTEEQEIINSATQKKAEVERAKDDRDRELEMRIKSIEEYFVRLSWRHKKSYIIAMASQTQHSEVLVRGLAYIYTCFGKFAAFADTRPEVKLEVNQILIDHDRTLDKAYLREIGINDLQWINTLNKDKQLKLFIELLRLGGNGLKRKLYIPLLGIYKKFVLKAESMQIYGMADDTDLEQIIANELDDTDKYPQDHPMSVEVSKMRKKWDDFIKKYRQEVFPIATKNEKPDKKPDKKGEKTSTKPEKTASKKSKKKEKESDVVLDWIQILPIWVTKKIFSYLDLKTLKDIKKVNAYWSYASDSLIKDRTCRKFIDETLEKLKQNVNPEILKQCEEEFAMETGHRRRLSPGDRRLMLLKSRGAIKEEMKTKIKKSEKCKENIITSLAKSENVCLPIEKLDAFPRLIKEDSLIYNEFPCLMKDVNILINIEDDVRRQRDTLTYSLSCQLSDIFSVSQITLEDW
ncbi:uncharacterized protein LOC115890060 [Sitophilus oryzae]|uniref:Uncharacterized protein LOC115890060 n=1 Tax=Sitophilus oryzae TaxID=7048 RepID=A0A6J2YRV5_SITOR|nr:uncharacterized protein LOC115890060 [Sitophilus oryzae]